MHAGELADIFFMKISYIISQCMQLQQNIWNELQRLDYMTHDSVPTLYVGRHALSIRCKLGLCKINPLR